MKCVNARLLLRTIKNDSYIGMPVETASGNHRG